MYSQGETFYYDIDDEEFELSVVENITMKDKEYIIAEDYDGELHVFVYDEDEEEIYLLEDSDAMEIIEYWQDEYMDGEDIGDYEDDEYYDREDEEYSDKYDNEDYYEDDVLEKYQVTPKEFIDVKALMGDASDNIPGIPGIGEKTATKLIKEFQSIENAYAHIDEVKPNRAKNNLQEYYDQGVMSKELATIKLDSPIDISFDDAKLGDLYTKEAYHMLKELEFKAILKRFDGEEQEDFEIKIKEIIDLAEAEDIFAKAVKKKEAGISIYKENDAMWVALNTEGEEVYLFSCEGFGFITQDFLYEKIDDLYDNIGYVAMMEVKEHLSHLTIHETTKSIFDVSLAAYLVNPLKSTYEYDDIARDYKSMMLPSKKELIDKKHPMVTDGVLSDAGKKIMGYEAYISREAIQPLSDKLTELEMMDLYREIEIPTMFALHDMEVRGIHVDSKALKEYGDQLVGRIEELQESIYKEAGEEFNINSPKQLGVVLFDHMKLEGAKKTKTGYSTSVEVLEKIEHLYPIIPMILEYRQLTKLKSTYADGLANFIQDDQRIHGKFNQTITATGRISSTEPNLQNIPIRMELGRAIRKVFLPKSVAEMLVEWKKYIFRCGLFTDRTSSSGTFVTG